MRTTYTYDGAAILREVRDATMLRYVHARRIDEPLAVDDGVGVSYLHADGLGSVVKGTDAAGTVTFARQYDAWGNLQAGADQPGYAFTGREWDSETGLYDYRARYYDPGLGRFISEDPLLFGDGVNQYTYVKNSPVRFSDPWGYQAAAPPSMSGKTMSGCDMAIDVMLRLLRLVHEGRVPDKVGHCLAHCYLTKWCPGVGPMISHAGGNTKESLDGLEGMIGRAVRRTTGISPPWPINPNSSMDFSDMDANEQGRSCSAQQTCWDRCKNAQSQFP